MKQPKKGGGTLRYVVIDGTGTLLSLGHYDDTPRGGILMIGDYGMTFSRRDQAQRAIDRTREYAASQSYTWTVHQFRIHRVSMAEARAR